MLKDTMGFKIDGYTYCGKSRSKKGFGGVGILVRNDLKQVITPHETSRDIEMMWISLRRNNEKNYLLWCVLWKTRV